MDELVLLVGLVICVASAVASAWFARKNNVRELQDTVDLLAENAEKAIRAARTARMREVRAATRQDDPGNAPPPELVPGSASQIHPSPITKAALRRQVFGTKQ